MVVVIVDVDVDRVDHVDRVDRVGCVGAVDYVDNKKQKQVFGKLIDANDQEISLDVDGIRSIISYDKIKKAKVKISFG